MNYVGSGIYRVRSKTPEHPLFVSGQDVLQDGPSELTQRLAAIGWELREVLSNAACGAREHRESLHWRRGVVASTDAVNAMTRSSSPMSG
jgi:hypothetical protein